MAITQSMCTSFMLECFEGVHDISTDTVKLALYTPSATLGAATTAYTTTNEVTGAGYTAGGFVLTGVTLSADSGGAFINFDDVTVTDATFTTRGAMLYNASKGNKAIGVLDFGSDKTYTARTFVIQMPPNTATSALLRFDHVST